MANTGLTLVSSCDVIACIIYGLEKKDLFVRPIVSRPPPCGEKLLSWVTVRKGEYRVTVIQGDKLWMSLKPWLLSVLSLGILGPMHRFFYGAPQNHIQWGVVRPPHRSVSLNRWALKLSSKFRVRVKPVSSTNMNGFHQLPALSPSKNTFTVGKTNTDNNHIEFGGFFFSPNNRHLETDHSWTHSVLSCFTFIMLIIIFHKTMLQQ